MNTTSKKSNQSNGSIALTISTISSVNNSKTPSNARPTLSTTTQTLPLSGLTAALIIGSIVVIVLILLVLFIIFWFYGKKTDTQSKNASNLNRNEKSIKGKFGDLDSGLNLNIQVSNISTQSTDTMDSTATKFEAKKQKNDDQTKVDKVKSKHSSIRTFM